MGLDIPTVIAQALRLEGWDAGSDAAPDVAEAGRTALELNARSLASPEEELADARKAFRECSSGATRLLAADLTAATTVAVAQLMDEFVDVDFVDVNMGCPIDLVCNVGAGSALPFTPPQGAWRPGQKRRLGLEEG